MSSQDDPRGEQGAGEAAEGAQESQSSAEQKDGGADSAGKIKPRFAVDFDLTLNSEHYFYAGSATNLSEGGFFVATHILQDIGEQFQFSIRLPEINRFVKGVGEVRWHRSRDEGADSPAGMGIRFVELEEGSREALDEFLANREPVRWDSS